MPGARVNVIRQLRDLRATRQIPRPAPESVCRAKLEMAETFHDDSSKMVSLVLEFCKGAMFYSRLWQACSCHPTMIPHSKVETSWK